MYIFFAVPLLCIMSSIQRSLLIMANKVVLIVTKHSLSMFRFSLCNIRFVIFNFILVLTMHPGFSIITLFSYIVYVVYTSAAHSTSISSSFTVAYFHVFCVCNFLQNVVTIFVIRMSQCFPCFFTFL
jgi:hypothetical protein